MATASRGKGRGAANGTAKSGARSLGAKAGRAPAEPRRGLTWFALTAAVVGGVLALRLGVNALGLNPVHFDEAQYWAYGQELDWGYFSKPPLVAAAIRATTDAFGDTLFGLRLSAPLAHALVAWMIFLTGARLWDGRTGFWAAAGYTLAPGVAFSSMLATTDPLLMAAWAVALYTMVRGLGGGGAGWWIACGAAIGLGLLAKYTMAAMPLAALVFLAFAPEAERRDWRGVAIACGVGLLVFAPNIAWNAAHGFATIAHVAEDADPGQGYLNPGELAAFAGAQLAVIGPPFFLALFPALLARSDWRRDWGMRLLLWQCWLLLGAMIALSLVTRANGNWAAPAYVAGALVAARWLLRSGWRGWLTAQIAIGASVAVVLWSAAALYAARPGALPAVADPFRKARLGPAFCALALDAMEAEGADVLLSQSRHRLSECMFAGDLGWDAIAVWNPDLEPANHHELVSTLRAGDERRMILAVTGDAAAIAGRFDRQRRIDGGEIATHRDRAIPYRLWVVQGFRGYDGG
ncbi:MAG TPA: glycosyltransferase family 39 protein [Thermohalobaculum sp.]|nr:glycosyltransferase family 39 protein [Thermohalobaculum sp.]